MSKEDIKKKINLKKKKKKKKWTLLFLFFSSLLFLRAYYEKINYNRKFDKNL